METTKNIQQLFLNVRLVPVDGFDVHFNFETAEKFATRANI